MTSQSGDTDTSRMIVVRLPIALHKALRIRVAEEDTSIQRWVEELVRRELHFNDGGQAVGVKKK